MEPPAGTVTMLFTDIEGSTRRARELGSKWPEVLEVHHRILRGAIERHRGYVDGTEGDAFFAYFENARNALDAAVEAQQELARAPWPNARSDMKVRMGLHTGWIERRDLGYVGVEVHRAARVGAAANGGQVLVTRSTQALVGSDVALEFVGEHRLKDFPTPEPLFHLVVDGRRAEEFARLRTAVARPTNLREDLRPFIGRDPELDRLQELLRSDTRLVTVVGPGGAGKTRLALAAARLMLDEMPGGAFIAPLGSVADPAAILGAIVTALGLSGANGDPRDRVVAWARDRASLVVLDNFEQLLSAAPLVSDLVSGAPELRLLVTSQAALNVGGEVVMTLDGLELDDAADLFTERALAVRPSWEPRAEDRETIARICRHVGCLPLAIELAAARASVLNPGELLARLERSSEVLSGGSRDTPARQRGLRAAFEWTHGLLQPEQRVLFRRLGVFSGPVSLDTIEAVCELTDDEQLISVLDALEGLIAFSLVARDERAGHGIGFTMPQALRDFARAELEAGGEEQVIGRRHAEHLAAVASEVRIWFSADPQARVRVLALDDEIRPALAWAATHDFELYRRLVSELALGLVLYRGQIREVLEHTSRACAELEAPADEVEAWLSYCRAWALLASGQTRQAASVIEPVVAFYRARQDARHLGLALNMAAWTPPGGDFVRAVELSRESLELLRGAGDQLLTNRGLVGLIQNLVQLGALEEADHLLSQAEASIEDRESELANRIATLRGDAALTKGELATALRHFVASLELAARRGDGLQMINDSKSVAQVLALSGHPEAALEASGAAAAIADESGHAIVFPDVEAAILAAEDAVGAASTELVARGRNLPPGQRVPRVLALGRLSARDSPT
jgi:predicted ATPase/class 3 adenylate cyclase